MTAMPSFIAKEAVRRECCELYARGMMGAAIMSFIIVALMLVDADLAIVWVAVSLLCSSIGVALGATLVERRVS